jgi:sulfonate dioxygenase
MAPSAIETSIVTEQRDLKSTVKLAGRIGPYKELSPVRYEKDAEERGRDGFEPAKVGYEIPLSPPHTVMR